MRKKKKIKISVGFDSLTDFDATLKEASIFNCPFSNLSPLALNSITLTAFPFICKNNLVLIFMNAEGKEHTYIHIYYTHA